MRNKGAKDAFAERLSRIEKTHSTGNTHLAMNQHGLRDLSPTERANKMGKRGRNPMLRLMVFAVMFVGGTLFALAFFKPEVLSAQMTLLSTRLSIPTNFSPSRSIKVAQKPEEKIAEGSNITLGNTGNGYPLSIVANEARAEIPIEVISQGGLPPMFDPKIELSLITPVKTCTVHEPLAPEKIYSVSIDEAKRRAPIELFTDAQIAARLNDWFKNGGALKAREMSEYMNIGGIEVADVFVTDTKQPVHLVLQNLYRGVIWRIHKAPDVEISEITLVAPRISGLIANDGPKITFVDVQSRNADTIGPGDVFSREGEEGEAICSNVPYRKPNESWEQWQKAEKNNTLYFNQRETFFKRFAEYNAWFKTRYGQNADENMIEASYASLLLVGPKPNSAVSFQSLETAPLQIKSVDHVLTGTPEENVQAKADAFATLLEKAAGGSMAGLNPKPRER